MPNSNALLYNSSTNLSLFLAFGFTLFIYSENLFFLSDIIWCAFICWSTANFLSWLLFLSYNSDNCFKFSISTSFNNVSFDKYNAAFSGVSWAFALISSSLLAAFFSFKDFCLLVSVIAEE